MKTAVREPELLPLDDGAALDGPTRRFFERRFGEPLDDVRVHTGPAAAENAGRLGAQAYTVGRHIVFANGRYDPHGPAGLDLLAHEVAHTIQQSGTAAARTPRGTGLAPGGDTLAGLPLSSAAAEAEADRAARTALRGPADHGAAGRHLARGAGPSIARRAIAWQPLPSPVTLSDGQTVDEWETHRPGLARFKVPLLHLPTEKGPVVDRYQAAAQAQALEATLSFPSSGSGGALRTALWQSRDRTSGLRNRWLTKVGWEADAASENWHQAGGEPNSGLPRRNPRAAGSTCDVDHVIELQLGGTNVPSNLMMLNSAENQASGRGLWQIVSTIARDLRDQIPAGPAGRPTEIVLAFQAADQSPPAPAPGACAGPGAATSCYHVDCCATSAAANATSADGLTPYPIVAGAVRTAFEVPGNNAPVDLLGTGQVNLQSAEAVPGIVLSTLTRGRRHEVAGFIESERYFKRSRSTRVPVLLAEEAAAVTFNASTDGDARRLTLRGNRRSLQFHYPYLSTGTLRPTFGDNGLEATGTLRPSIPLLSRASIDVRLADGVFEGTASIDPSRIRLGPLRATEADLAVQLAPDFGVTGGFAFEVGRLARGRLTARADPSAGFVAEGTIEATIPGLDEASGTINYRNGTLSGLVVVRTEQLSRLPGNPQGELRVAFDDEGAHPTGELTATLPGGDPVTLGVRGTARGYEFYGSTTLALPGLEPLQVRVIYDGEHFRAQGTTGVTYGGLSGNVTLRYRDGGFSGDGTARLQRGRVNGVVNLHIARSGDLYGDGQVAVELGRGVTATVAVRKPQRGPLRVEGTLALPPSIEIFRRLGNEASFPFPTLRIPILGFSVGFTSVGLIAVIGGDLGFRYGVGPGTIDDAQVTAGFNPLEDAADFELRAHAEIRVPADASVFVRVSAGLALDAAIASVRGELSVRADLGIEGGINMPFDLHYRNSQFLITSELRIFGSPFFELRLVASIIAEALRETFVKRWDWELARYRFGSGFTVAIIFPFRYQSGTPFRLPSTSDIRFEYPEIDFDRLLPALAEAANR